MNLKRTLFFGQLLLFLVLFSAQKCDKNKMADCHQDRKTMQTIKLAEGIVTQQGSNYIILVEKEQKQYAACNLPEEWKVNNKIIRFSGLEKEVYPHERWAGLPFVLTDIAKP